MDSGDIVPPPAKYPRHFGGERGAGAAESADTHDSADSGAGKKQRLFTVPHAHTAPCSIALAVWCAMAWDRCARGRPSANVWRRQSQKEEVAHVVSLALQEQERIIRQE